MENIRWESDSTISNNSVSDDAELDIQVTDLNWQGKQTTSLCDRFGLHMFTEAFKQGEEKVIQEEQAEKELIFTEVLNHSEPESMNDRVFTSVMSAEVEVVIKENYAQTDSGEIGVSDILCMILGIVIAGIVIWFINRRKKNENHDYRSKLHRK